MTTKKKKKSPRALKEAPEAPVPDEISADPVEEIAPEEVPPVVEKESEPTPPAEETSPGPVAEENVVASEPAEEIETPKGKKKKGRLKKSAPEPESTDEAPSDEAAALVEGEATVEAEPSEETPVASEEVVSEEVPTEEAEPEPEATLGWELSQVLEAILFASQKPVSVKEIQNILKGAAEADKENPLITKFAKARPDDLRDAIEVLEKHSADPKRAYEVRESAAGWQLVTKPDYSPWLRQLFPENRPARLSAPALETLAIIAYRQPITRADLEAVRGVAVDGVMQTLMDRGLVKIAGRAEIPGRPLLYETTQNFMEHFGLKNLNDLPNADELRKVQLPKAPVAEKAAAEATPTPAAPVAPAPEPETPPVELFDNPPANEESEAPASPTNDEPSDQ